MVQTFAEVERQQWESMQNEWEREKHKILNTLLGSGPDTFEFQQETEVGVAFLCVCFEVGGGGGSFSFFVCSYFSARAQLQSSHVTMVNSFW